jgi:hypothetical protein
VRRRTGASKRERERGAPERGTEFSASPEREMGHRGEMEHRRSLVSGVGLGSDIFSGEL